MDGRLMLERLKQVPEYVEMFDDALGSEPSFGGTLQAIAAFMETIVSRNVPFDSGEMDAAERRGLELFDGKAGCVRCHSGPYFSDGQAHVLGIAEDPEIVGDPLRHLTMRSFFKGMGVPGFETIEEDVGYFSVTKVTEDRGSFVTPTLREITRTAPYMHNGSLPTLEDVVRFYDRGGTGLPDNDPLLVPLGLTDEEQLDLIAFLHALSGDEVIVEPPTTPDYRLIEDWMTVRN
jgi:cytochrome c peroxidase